MLVAARQAVRHDHLAAQSVEGHTAQLHANRGERAPAAMYYQKQLDCATERGTHTDMTVNADAYLFLAMWCKEHGKRDEAMSHCHLLLEHSVGAKRREAEALLREMHATGDVGVFGTRAAAAGGFT